MNSILRIARLAGLLSMAGCAGMAGVMGAHVNAYPGKERPIEEVAVLFPANAMLAKVDGKHVGDNTLGYPSDVRVLPGERKIMLDCMFGNFKVKPTEFTGRFVAGHFYNMLCHDQGDGAFAGDMKDLGTEDPRKKT
ncbi:MAG TPA: hypothetical protein VGO61_04275 [Steroidobacteraceae bacterium]|jgi:hypothetical protein|nr:hypothetical protein [Steroidobacteraceae bacterium]